MPKKAIFKQKQIFNKAFELFEKHGLEEITARNVAKALNASPAPIYSYYESMDVLKNELVEKAKSTFLEYLNNDETELKFLNIGLGIAMFAREEKQLFRSIFLKDLSYRDLIEEFKTLAFSEMEKDERFIGINVETKEEIITDGWIYAHGLSALIATNYFQNPTNEFIKERLLKAPAELIYKKLEDIRKSGK